VRYWSMLLFFLSAAASSAASGPPNAETVAQLEREGQSLFFACEFKRAAHVFERALSMQPNSAALYYWLGKSYVRLADVSSPLCAPKKGRRARRNLKEAVKRDPQNNEYRRELFDFYVESPECSDGGLQRAAALLELFSPADPDPDSLHREIAYSRKEHSGPRWWMRRAVLCTSDAIGQIVPER
jgi:tetratricopeptide (TPR) repeat protein